MSKNCAVAARRLGTDAGTARAAVHRLRKRLREIYREEISKTMGRLPDHPSPQKQSLDWRRLRHGKIHFSRAR